MPGADPIKDAGDLEKGCYYWDNCVKYKNVQNSDKYVCFHRVSSYDCS